MKKTYSIILSLAVLMGVNGKGTVSAQEFDAFDPQKLIEVGKKIFFDANLSVNKKQSCASCHDPAAGFTGPDSAINAAGAVEPGAIGERFGNRKPPSSSYAGESPILYYDADQMMWFGGMFWDGRATGWTLGDPLAEQAMGPFLNPLEMAMPDTTLVVQRVAKSEYAEEFEAVWGPGSLDWKKDSEASYERIARTIAAYERSYEVNPFTSKFDFFYDNAKYYGIDIKMITTKGFGNNRRPGGARAGEHWTDYRGLGLNDDELKGLAIFNDSQRMGADCASCHTFTEGSAGYPLFTDFGYYNLGIPKNPDNPYYTMPKKWNPDGENGIDYGLGGYLKSAGYAEEVYTIEIGKHKTPSLRNIDQRPDNVFVKAFGHNGFFKSLDKIDGIVHFYAWRATMDAGGMGGGSMGGGMAPDPNLFPPPEYDANRIQMKPFNFMMHGNFLISFLMTLTDGYLEQ